MTGARVLSVQLFGTNLEVGENNGDGGWEWVRIGQ